MKKSAILTSLFLLSALGSPLAKATVITSASAPALAGATVETFSSAALGSYATLTLGGLTITGSGDVVVSNYYAGQYATTGNSLENNSGNTSVIRFNFNNPVSAMGFYYGAINNTWVLSIYNASNQLLATTDVLNTGLYTDGFVGMTSNSANIAYATFTDTTNMDYILIDDVMYTQFLAKIQNALQVDAIALNLRGINLGAIDTATRDVNARLFRLRAFGTEQCTGNNASQTASLDSRGKVVLPPQPTRRLEFFAQGDFGSTARDTASSVSGYGGWTEVATVGAEYGLSENLTAGLALGYIHNNTTVADKAGRLTLDGGGASTYLSWAKNNYYVDGLYNFSIINNNIRRNVIGGGAAEASPNNYGNKAELNGGRNFTYRGLVFGPTASVKYIHGYLDTYTDSQDVKVRGQYYDSLVSELGMQASLPKTVSFGRVTPQVRAGWGHEYLNSPGEVTASLDGITATASTPTPTRDYALIGGGVMAEIGSRVSVLCDYQAQLSDYYTNHVFSLRAGYQF